MIVVMVQFWYVPATVQNCFNNLIWIYTNNAWVWAEVTLMFVYEMLTLAVVSLCDHQNCNGYEYTPFIHSVFCLTTGPKPPPKRCLHIVWSRASSFKWDYPLLSVRSSSSSLRLLPRLLATSISPFIFPSITCFRRQFLHKMLEEKKVKVSCDRPRWPEGLRVGLGPRFSWRFGTTMVVGRQPNTPATFTPGEIPGTHFQRLSQPQGTWFCQGSHGKNPQWHHRKSIPGPPD